MLLSASLGVPDPRQHLENKWTSPSVDAFIVTVLPEFLLVFGGVFLCVFILDKSQFQQNEA